MKFLLASWGSAGDLHPFLALSRALRRRGHEITMIGVNEWKPEFLRLGFDYVAVGPDLKQKDILEHPDIISTRNFGLNSLKALMEIGVAPMMDDAFRAICELAPEHDVLVAHHFFLPAGAASEKAGIPWATVTLTPCMIPSRYSLPAGQGMHPFTGILGRLANQAAWKLAQLRVRSVVDPVVNRQRESEGLAPIQDALFDSVSKTLNLALYSEEFSPRSPDFPESIHVTGFCHWDPPAYQPPAELDRFLYDNPKPWLFTLGSSVVANPQDFFNEAAEGMRGQKERAVLLVGDMKNAPKDVPSNVFVHDHAPYGWIMPRCSVVAHQCGIGTTAQALRAGLPAVACPYAFDQPQNAVALEATGAALFLPARKRTASQLIRAMRIVSEGEVAQRAAEIGRKLREEDGAVRACELLERTFNPRPHPSEGRIYGFVEGLAVL